MKAKGHPSKSKPPTDDTAEAWKLARQETEANNFIRLLSKRAQSGDGNCLQMLKMLAVVCGAELDACARTGDKEAILAVVDTAMWGIQGLEALYSPAHLETLKNIARKRTAWPGFLNLHRELKQEAEKTIHLLELGAASGLNYKGKGFSLQSQGTFIALSLKEHLELLRRPLNRPDWFTSLLGVDPTKESEFKEINRAATALPDLDRNTYGEWWKVAERAFVFGIGHDFENAEMFKGYWKNAQASNRSGKPSRAKIRDEIRKSIKQGFKSIAAHST